MPKNIRSEGVPRSRSWLFGIIHRQKKRRGQWPTEDA